MVFYFLSNFSSLPAQNLFYCSFCLFNANYGHVLVKFLILIEPPKANKSKTLYMSPLDDIILDFMMEQDIPGASFALSKDGKLLYCQGEELISQEIIFDCYFIASNKYDSIVDEIQRAETH